MILKKNHPPPPKDRPRRMNEEKLHHLKEHLAFPETKKEALARASFFAYFLDSIPTLSEMMEPLRRLARPKTRFKPSHGSLRIAS